jgi:lipoyl(octanoyl) transferase
VSDDLTPYDVAWRWQKTILDARLASLSAARDQADDRTRDDRTASPSSLEKDDPHHRLLGASDCLLLVQHPSVVTLGTGSTPANLKFDPDDPSAPFEVFRTERGGEATYHGPGQIVLYPILDLAQRKPDLHWYMRSLEEVAILAMKDLGVMYAGRIEGLTGGWANVTGDADACANLSSMNETTDDRPSPVANRAHKVAAIGVRARRWVTYHGMAFNVDPDLSEFRHIVPCGIADRPVGSIAQILEGQAGITSSGAEDSRRTRRNECSDSGRAAGIGPDAALMRRAKKALVRAFEEVFETALIQRGGAPPV